ncbi:MAG: TM0106 family RecB-like putative nuclease [Chloroflexi bacterium]|nr:TM0106 family RecB-like putative nuclease [Chloroflexota bacterium]
MDGQPVFSATDLVGYLACEHLTALEAAAMRKLVVRPVRDDPELDVIRRRGEAHERRYLAELQAAGRRVVSIERHDEEKRGDQLRRQASETLSAMEAGVDVVYQATFFDGRWLGYADFLLRIDDPDRPSAFGAYHYEVADTKLARHVKAGAVLQLCSYVEQLQRIQHVLPEEMKVVLGGSAHEIATLRTRDYMAYYRAAKRRFEHTTLGTEASPAPIPAYPPAATYPDPVEHCGVCRWAVECDARRSADDHLSLVAGITSRQRKALQSRNVTTLTQLAQVPIPFDPVLEGTSASAVERVREQARIQLEGRGLARPIHELLRPKPGEPIEPERGLATLPAADAGDLFFDIEGDPYAFEDGVDYLFGVLDTRGLFTAFWSMDPERPGEVSLAGEKAAFEAFIDFVMARLEASPNMHVYHYAAYEPTALKRLMGRYATREREVDRLLRGGVLIDLFRAVRQGLRASVESYSIKKIEALYDFKREVSLRDAGSSIVEFEAWLELGEDDRPASDILGRIEGYNRDDVRSNADLRSWLEDRRLELAQLTGQEVPRPARRSMDAPEELNADMGRVAELAERLTADVPPDASERDEAQAAGWLLAQLLSWHRREKKVAYWDFFRRVGLTPEELVAEDGAIGPLELVGQIGQAWLPTPKARKMRRRWRYRFPPQEHDDVKPGSEIYDPGVGQERPTEWMSAWKVPAQLDAIDDIAGSLDLVWTGEGKPRHPEAIVGFNSIRDGEQRAALLRLGEWVARNGVDAPGPWRAGRDLLLRRPPRCGQRAGEPLRRESESDLEAARRLVACLREGTLAIQGPPGSGKTYTGARMIVDLLAAGKRVGISATSHKVISNFVREVLKAAESSGADVRAIQKTGVDVEGVTDDRVTLTPDDNDKVRKGLLDGTYNLAAGTAWLWAPEQSDGLLDLLFVDEAGQISLSNVLAMAGAAGSIVLLGDPQQLDQPLQGSHPPGADRSALAHLLAEHDTMPPDRGLFLERTWRLHPRITTFTSEAFYEGRLESQPGMDAQALRGAPPLGGVGLRLVDADHVGSDNDSPEEAAQVADLVRGLVETGASWVDAEGEEHELTYGDILIVAPYNAQVGEIAKRLPAGARVGTVDKFQGQEAPVSIYSMTTSSPEDAPRGMDFLYSRHRLNVATSRARCVTVVVAEPALLRVRARTPEQMRLANALCQFVKLAEVSGSARGS